MESAAAEATFVEVPLDDRPAAILRGTARGLEAVVIGSAPLDAISAAIEKRIDEAPAFFRGSDIRIRVEDGPLALGSLARLETLASKYQLRIVEVTAAKKQEIHAIPQPNLAAGSAPSAVDFETEAPTNASAKPLAVPPPPKSDAPIMLADSEVTELDALVESLSFDEPTNSAVPIQLAATAELDLETVAPGARLVVGPVRSGVILEHTGHVIVFGDVNPGAEVRATGNIIVLGRLRGTAHAGIGQDVGFILALQLQPQQLRIGRQVARAAEGDAASNTEIAYLSGQQIVVERYTGRLPNGLATSI